MTDNDGISLRQGKRQKFYSKSLASLVPVLSLIGEGMYQEQIALKLDLDPQRVHYYVRRAIEMGWVRESARSTVRILELTQEGKKVLDQWERGHYPMAPTNRYLLENLQLAAEIIEGPTKPVNWKRVQMTNWVQYRGKVDKISVTINEGKTKKVVFTLTNLPGDRLLDMLLSAIHEYHKAAFRMFELFGIRLGHPEQASRPEYVAYDPLARQVCKDIGQVTIPGVAKINASRPLSRGEMEYHDLEDLASYALMPRRLQHVKRRLDELTLMTANNYLKDWHPCYTQNN